MKTKLITLLLISIVALPLAAAPPHKGKSMTPLSATIDNEQYINVNRILMFVTNHGNFCRDLAGVFGQDAGTFYPYTTIEAVASGAQNNYCLYASGLWVGGRVNGETRVIIAEYSDEYVPGPMQNGTYMEDRPEFKLYKLYRDSMATNPNEDWLNWPVDQGAPVDELGNPEMVGDQMLWAVFNDANPDQHTNDAGRTDPLGLEVQQTTFAFDRTGSLGNIIFVRLKVLNKGGNTIEDCYMSLWCDPDLGDHTDDLVGCDTLTSLGFVYNSDDDDSQYGATPPCVGYDFFQGPMVAGAATDTARMWGQLWPGMKNLGMVSFNKYINGTDPNDFNETYNYMQGKEANGDPYIYDGQELLYFNSGDPVAGTGDLDVNAADRRWMQSTGPITFAPGDSAEILAAIIVGQGSNRLNSISVMRELDEFAQLVYENNFNPPKPPAKPEVHVGIQSGDIVLTWGDTSETDPGDFPFEGYTVWQGETASGPWTELATWDIDGGYSIALVDSVRDSYSQLILPWVRRALTDGGLNYRYRATTDAIDGGPLRDVKEYYFRVTAFSFAYEYVPDPTKPEDTVVVPNGDRLLESETVMTIVPEPPRPGTDLGASMWTDTLPVTQTYGVSDGEVLPIVMDPLSLTGDTYKVWFTETATQDTLWNLMNNTTGDTLLQLQDNLSGDEEYLSFDGLLIKVIGAPAGVKPNDVLTTDNENKWGWDIPSGTRRFTWAGGADGFGWEGFQGALGWGGPGDTHGFGEYQPLPPTSLVKVELRLANVDVDGNFDTDQDNVSYGYRYMRGGGTPARPEFAPYILDPDAGSYGFQEFAKNVPLAAWDVSADPERRLVVGFLENNGDSGYVDGKYWPPYYEDANNTSGTGSREWLWIYLDDYSETPNPDYQLNSIDDSMPIMYWACWARRAEVAWSDEDVFAIFPTVLINPTDTFTFVSVAPSVTKTESLLDAITVAPNPFYLYGPYDPTAGNYQIKFHNLPEECTITIYNLAGEFVREIVKDDPTTGIATWGANTWNNLPVASGIYIYVVDAPGYGQKIGKMAVFMEVEVLDTY